MMSRSGPGRRPTASIARRSTQGAGPRTGATALVAGVVCSLAACSAIGIGGGGCPSSETDEPTMAIWYGDEQRVGHLGIAQSWFNVLGAIDEPERAESLSARLNGGTVRTLSIGPDDRRLANDGDFNVDLEIDELQDGRNELVLEIIDCDKRVGRRTVTIDRTAGATAAGGNTTFDWVGAASIDELAQVVDGRWEIDGGLRTLEFGYDRLVAVGDIAWTNYDVTVPITVHAIDDSGFESKTSGWGAGVGIITHWTGHGDRPVEGWQPASGWYPYGSIGWYWWHAGDAARLRLEGNEASVIAAADDETPPPLGVPFMLRARVESADDGSTLYSLKSWPAGASEPAGWDLSGPGAPGGPTQGSLLLVAHHVDATFGPVTVELLGTAGDT